MQTKEAALMWRGVCGLALLLAAAGSAEAQQWAVDMFDHTSHDFGVVARGAKVEHVFTLENIYVEAAHIADVRSTCGCTSPEIDTRSLKTWDKSHIKAVLDTRAFLGRKDATIRVVFDKPFPAEVQLHVHSYIRSDVVVQPGAVEFGNVAQGTAVRQKVTVSYAGRSDWKIDRVESPAGYITAQAVESPDSQRAAGQITYDLWVTLSGDAPAGYLRDHLVLVTNDYNKQSSRVPVAVEGIVAPSLTVRPSPLLLPVLEVGKSATRQLVVQGQAPFRVTGVRCDDPRFAFRLPETAKDLQLIPVTFTADGQPGKLTQTIHIDTDVAAGGSLDVAVCVQVVPSQESAQQPSEPPQETPTTQGPAPTAPQGLLSSPPARPPARG
jgi:hypothetical protein